MTDKKFCEIEIQHSGEPIDKVEQLQMVKFTGRELKEYIEFAIIHLRINRRSTIIKSKASDLPCIDWEIENAKTID